MNRKKLYKTFEALQLLLSNKSIPLIYEALDLFSPLVDELKNNTQNLFAEGPSGIQRRKTTIVAINEIIKKEKISNTEKSLLSIKFKPRQ